MPIDTLLEFHLNTTRTIRLLALLGVIAFSLQACSTQFAYNRLDWLISWYMGDYIELDREQKVLLKQRLEPLLDWHRYEELDNYVGILDRIKLDIEGPVTAQEVNGWSEDVSHAAERIESRMLTLMLDMGDEMSDEQFMDFREKLWSSQEKYEKKYLKRDDREYSKANFKTLSKNLRRFMGRLDKAQLEVLEQAADNLQRFDRAWLADREHWLTIIEPLLAREAGWQEAILLAHGKREESRTLKYREMYAHNRAVLNRAIAEVLNSRSEKQQAKLLKELAKWRTDLLALSAKGPLTSAVTP